MTDRPTFFRHVREVFARLDDRPYLQAHPLVALLSTSSHTASAEALRRNLVDAIEQLRPPKGTPAGSAKWRQWRCLVLRYVEGASTERIARQLQVSDRQARRDHAAGVDAVAAILWAQYRKRIEAEGEQPTWRFGVGGAAPESTIETASLPSSATIQEDLEAELARVSAYSPGDTTSVVEALQSALATVRSLAEARNVHFEIALPSDLRPAAISYAGLRHILLCLLTAALEDAPGALVTVSGADVLDRIELTLSIRDGDRSSDEGMSSSEIEMLTTAARRLAEPSGGTLHVGSARDGTRQFVLTLPSTRLVTVLVVDDNPDVAQLFRRYLAGENYHLIQARTPPTALELARELHPDVIMLDVLLPSQDGWQVFQQLQSDPTIRDIPVIVCSILPERPLALSLGATDFLAKPVTPESLRSALKRCLRLARPTTHPGYSEGTSSAHQPSGHPRG